MKKIIYLITLLSFNLINSQCFDCAKNIGGHVSDAAIDIEKSSDGIVYLVDAIGSTSSGLNKYDFNCNLIWSKDFTNFRVAPQAITSDSLGNIYILIQNNMTNSGPGPWNIDGFMMSPGLNFYKLNSLGVILWHKNIGPNVYENMQNIFFYQDQLFITGTFAPNLTFSNGLTLNVPASNFTGAFIAKYDADGNFINAINFGDGNDIFKYSEIDNQGSIYLTRSRYNGSNSYIDKFNSSLQLSWSQVLSSSIDQNTTGIYIPSGIKYNNENNKLYIWGKMSLTTNIMGNSFFISNNNSVFHNALLELNSANGNLENIKRFDNITVTNMYLIYLNQGRSAYMAEKNGDLYILTSFTGTLVFPNATADSTIYLNNPTCHAEDLVLFKIKLSNFTSEFLFQSKGIPSLYNCLADNVPGNIVFNGDDLYLTSTFASNPMQLNGAIINNNSGNLDSDAMLYKFNINSSMNSGNININNSCFNNLTEFSINGDYDSIIWDFGDPSSLNNSSSIDNPSHIFSIIGNYHITALVTCGSNTQTVEKDIKITNVPNINSINSYTECETVQGSGKCSEFDTSNLNSLLIGNQQNVSIEFRNSNNLNLQSPLPNPYTNSNPLGDLITAKVFYTNNPNCFVETSISFNALPKPTIPTLTSPQTFCIQQNSTISDIIISGSNIKWYDAQTLGVLLTDSTLLVNGTTYYATQTLNNCESLRVLITVKIQNTQAPTGSANQSFCATQNATLNSIIATGNIIKWYASTSSTIILPASTLLVNGLTYYATQTINGCESVNRLAVTISLITTLNAINYSKSFCDDLSDGVEAILLSDYKTFLLSTLTTETFTYYNSNSSAENQITADKINPNYTLTTGNKIIFVRIDSSNGCHQVVELKLTLFSAPTINIKDIIPICENATITVNAGNGFNSYVWSTGVTNQQSIVINQAGNYSVTVSKNNGSVTCYKTKNFTVAKSNIATISSIESSDWTDEQNTISVILSQSSIGNYEYSLDGIKYQDSPIFNNLRSGFYTIYVNDKNNCGKITDDVFLLMYPVFFTPNDDGFNDFWKIKLSEFERGLTIKIFDRFGKFLKLLDNDDYGWDGTYNQKTLPSDDYWFVVTRANGKEFKNHFTLKR